MVSAAATQQKGPGFDSLNRQGLSVWSSHVLLVSAWLLSQSKDMHDWLIGDSKLRVSVSGCLSLGVSLAMNW